MSNNYWDEKAKKLLEGRTIVSVSYLTSTDVEMLGWNYSAIVLTLDDGTHVYPSKDDEGNDAGALFVDNIGGKKAEFETLPVIKLEE